MREVKKDQKTPSPLTPDALAAANAVIRRIVGAEDTKASTTRLDTLPQVSSLFRKTKDMTEALENLKSGHSAKAQIKEQEKILGESKDWVISTCVGCAVPGFRHGQIGVTVDQRTRASLNRDRLVQELLARGLDATVIGEIIRDSTVEGEPFYQVNWLQAKG